MLLKISDERFIDIEDIRGIWLDRVYKGHPDDKVYLYYWNIERKSTTIPVHTPMYDTREQALEWAKRLKNYIYQEE